MSAVAKKREHTWLTNAAAILGDPSLKGLKVCIACKARTRDLRSAEAKTECPGAPR